MYTVLGFSFHVFENTLISDFRRVDIKKLRIAIQSEIRETLPKYVRVYRIAAKAISIRKLVGSHMPDVISRITLARNYFAVA